MDPVPTRYIDRDGSALAYQVIADGPPNVVSFFEIVLHLDLCWMDPDLHYNLERGANFAGGVIFQRRGFGLSDQVTYVPDDRAAGRRRPGHHGCRRHEHGHPGGDARHLWADGSRRSEGARARSRPGPVTTRSPKAPSPRTIRRARPTGGVGPFVDGYRRAFANWGSGQIIDMWDPAQGTAYNRRLMALLERSSATPAAAQAYLEWLMALDIQDVLRSVRVPTRVLRVPTNTVPEAASRYVAELVPGADFHAPAGHEARYVDGSGLSAGRRPHRGDGHGTRPLGRVRPLPRHRAVHRRRLVHRAAGARRRCDVPRPALVARRQVRLAVETTGGELVNVRATAR